MIDRVLFYVQMSNKTHPRSMTRLFRLTCTLLRLDTCMQENEIRGIHVMLHGCKRLCANDFYMFQLASGATGAG